MQGEMNDVAGKVWTYLAGRGNAWTSLLEVIQHGNGDCNDAFTALILWINLGEVEEFCDKSGIFYFRIKDCLCQQNAPECATYAEYQRSLRSQPASKRQSATPSARKNGSGSSGRKPRRKAVR